MKILSEFFNCLKNMERISKNILFAGIVCSLCVYLLSVVLLMVYSVLADDFTTGLYWYRIISELSVRIVSASLAPVFIFEILCISKGLK
ncbi:MAG: hypothetical protein J1E34_10315 [Oscillospiraceae bacterium]|nr:hypothetical protein [Oscillospiraceae bacterium]